MAIREYNMYGYRERKSKENDFDTIRVGTNRGANGIDGVLSTA